MADAISSLSDADLIALGKTILAALTSVSPAAYGSTAAKVTSLTARVTTFEDDYNTSKVTSAADQAANATKATSRGFLLVEAREFLGVAKATSTSKADMELLGVPQLSPLPTATFPLAKIDTSRRFTHILSWSDAGDGTHRRRPKGVMGAEIWVKIGDPAPISEKDCVFLAVDSATPYVASYEGTDAGKIAHYMIRWRMTDGTLGTWGETVSATITG